MLSVIESADKKFLWRCNKYFRHYVIKHSHSGVFLGMPSKNISTVDVIFEVVWHLSERVQCCFDFKVISKCSNKVKNRPEVTKAHFRNQYVFHMCSDYKKYWEIFLKVFRISLFQSPRCGFSNKYLCFLWRVGKGG